MRPTPRRAARPAKLPPLLPRPTRAEAVGEAFALRDGLPIVLRPGASPQDDETALRLRDGIVASCGARLAIETHQENAGLGPCVTLQIDPSALPACDDPEIAPQRYLVQASPEAVIVTGAGPSGLRYGVETLLQLVGRRGRVPGCRIEDSPALAMRGLMLDVSRGKVPTRATLESLLDLCVALKLNVVMLYTEHTFRFRHHPEIGCDDDPLDAETMRALDRYAAARFIDLIPCLQSLGHMEHVLKLDRYRHLAETDRGWTIAPANPDTYTLLGDLYAEYLPNFRSRWFNANCDEPWDLGQGQSAERSEALGPGGLYLEHVHRVRDLAAAQGKRTMIWGDVVHAHPDRIPEIERDLVLLDWWYEADLDYDRVAVFARHGIDFLVCPGTSSWNCLFPRIENSAENIARWAAAGVRHGARGLINTDWGDNGHYNLQGHSLFGFAWGAQESWSPGCDAKSFDRAFSQHVFGDSRGAVAKLYRTLGALHDPGFAVMNSSALQHLFFERIESGYFINAAQPAKLKRLLARLDTIRPKIAEMVAKAPSQHAQSITRGALDEMLWAADASDHAVRKTMRGQEYDAWRSAPEGWRAAERKRLARALGALADEQAVLGRRLGQLWLARSRPSNLDFTRKRLQRSIRSLRAAARSLTRNAPGTAAGRTQLTPKGALEAMRESLGRT